LTSTAAADAAAGGAAGSGGASGLRQGGGLCLVDGEITCLDACTQSLVTGDHASTSDADIFGDFTSC
jgi:hypothetical protein